MTNYYFLASALPALQFPVHPEMSFQELQTLLENNLTNADFKQVQQLRRFYDIQNMRAFWKGEPLDYRGNLSELDLEEALLSREGLPSYVNDFLDRYDSKELRLHNFSELVANYFKIESQQATGFMKEYLEFERVWRLVLTGFRALHLGKDLAVELQFEDPNDDLVAQILAQKDAKSFIPPDDYQELQPIFETYVNDPIALHQALCEYRYRKIEAIAGVDLFSIGRILGYMARLILVEKWIELDKQKGMDVVGTILKR